MWDATCNRGPASISTNESDLGGLACMPGPASISGPASVRSFTVLCFVFFLMSGIVLLRYPVDSTCQMVCKYSPLHCRTVETSDTALCMFHKHVIGNAVERGENGSNGSLRKRPRRSRRWVEWRVGDAKITTED